MKAPKAQEATEPKQLRLNVIVTQVLTGPDGKVALVYDKLTRYQGWVDLTEGEAFFDGRRVFRHVPAKVKSVKPHKKGQQILNKSAATW